MDKQIVLFGGSNSVATYGLRAGLSINAELKTLALGFSTSIQSLYELNRDKNQKYIKNADLIVVESNLNEILSHSNKINMQIEQIALFAQWFYESLAKYNKAVCVLILPYWDRGSTKINNIHRYFANLYGFNLIDMHRYYEQNDLKDFAQKLDRRHQMKVIMKKLGKNISKNIDIFKKPKQNISSCKLPNFKILTPDQMKQNGVFQKFNPKSSLYDEIVFRLDKNNYLSLKDNKYLGYKVIGMHSWCLEYDGALSREPSWQESALCRNAITMSSKTTQVRKHIAKYNQFCEIQSDIELTNDFIVKFNDEYIISTEIFMADHFLDLKQSYSSHFDLVALFLCSPYDKNAFLNLKLIPDNENIKINHKLDFTHFVPDIEFYRDCMDFIDEYLDELKPKIKEYIQKELLT